MPTLGAIADDFTGATDLATMLVARGYRTVVTVGPDGITTGGAEVANGAAAADGAADAPAPSEHGTEAVRRADAVVVALKSRTAPVDEAVDTSLAALHALRAAGCRHFYLKYCSTFDSTPEGNIGPVTDALLEAVGEHRTVVVPAFPATGRTVYQGRLFVHDEPLDESPMRHHPLTPMRDSHIGRLLTPQTRHLVAQIDLDTVRAGTKTLRRALDAPELADALVVVDARTDDDLRTISAATADMRLVTGAAGLALGRTGPHTEAARTPATSHPGDPGAILSGSASAATRAQVAHGRAHLPHRKLDLTALRADFTAAVADLTAFARACWKHDPERPPLIYAVDDLRDLEQPEPRDGPATAELVEQALARCAADLVDAGARRLLVAGGETSGAVVAALAVHTLAVGAPIDPGVTWTRAEGRTHGREHTTDLALKSGNFGSTEIFTQAWSTLA